MAYIVGIVSKSEKEELERRGWEVEPAKDYCLIGDNTSDDTKLFSSELAECCKRDGSELVVIFVDANVFDVMDGPDWDHQADWDDVGCVDADVCENCGEAEHVYYCPKPDNIPKEDWQKLSDDERLEAEKKAGYGYYDKVMLIINDVDPEGLIRMGAPENEYSPEIKRICEKLDRCTSVEYTLEMVYALFCKMFSVDSSLPKEKWLPVAQALYALKSASKQG